MCLLKCLKVKIKDMNENNTPIIDIFLPAELRPICIHNNLRIGSKHDGGYMINLAAINSSDFLLSFGLSEDWRFEEDFLGINSIPLHMYDHTVTRFWLIKNVFKNSLKMLIGRYRFKNLRLSFRALFVYDLFFRRNNVVHYLNKIVKESNSSTEANFFDTLEKTSSNNIFLKIDIEGSEYQILDQILASKDRLTSLVIEFHSIDLFYKQFMSFINGMTSEFYINSININNFANFSKNSFPKVLEISMSKCSEQGLHQLNRQVEFLCTPNNDLGPKYIIKFAGLYEK